MGRRMRSRAFWLQAPKAVDSGQHQRMLIVLEKSFWKESVEINKTYYIFGQVEGTEEFQISKSVMISDNFYCHGDKDQQTGGHLSTPLALSWEPQDLVLSSWDRSHLVGCGRKEDLGEPDWESISSAPICPPNATLIDSLTLRPLSKTLATFAHPAPTLCFLVTALWFFFGDSPTLGPCGQVGGTPK